MATTINEATIIKLLDGTELSVRPLKISLLREFMTKFDAIQEVADSNDKSMDVLMECINIALKQYKPELVGNTKGLEEILDLPTVYKIVEEASGIKMADSSLIGNF